MKILFQPGGGSLVFRAKTEQAMSYSADWQGEFFIACIFSPYPSFP
jgi:hypothetical protein